MSTATNSNARLALIEQATFETDNPGEVRARIKALVDAGEVRLQDISKVTSYDTSTISSYLGGKYEGDVAKLADGVARFYRQWLVKYAFVETKQSKQMHAMMEIAWKRKTIAGIIADFGRGKTKASSHYCAEKDYAVYIVLNTLTSPTDLLNRMGAELNISAQMKGTRSDRLQAIIRALQRKPRLFIIDEADELTPKTLAILRDIYGDNSERCGIVLLGTESLLKLLDNPDLGYLRHRITRWMRIGEIEFEEVRTIIDMWPHKLDTRHDLRPAWEWSLKRYGVHSMVNLIQCAYDEMKMKDKKFIDDDCLERAYIRASVDG